MRPAARRPALPARIITAATALLLLSCPRSSGGEQTWLTGSTDSRLTAVARHLRGLDVAMVEIGHRYNELHWAGVDRNWQYARYQIAKIRTTLDLAVERRPKRAISARMAEPPLVELERAAQDGDSRRFQEAMRQLTRTCNSCHVAEMVPFMHVSPPTHRAGPLIRPPAK